jgi:hypothetical protein
MSKIPLFEVRGKLKGDHFGIGGYATLEDALGTAKMFEEKGAKKIEIGYMDLYNTGRTYWKDIKEVMDYLNRKEVLEKKHAIY